MSRPSDIPKRLQQYCPESGHRGGAGAREFRNEFHFLYMPRGQTQVITYESGPHMCGRAEGFHRSTPFPGDQRHKRVDDEQEKEIGPSNALIKHLPNGGLFLPHRYPRAFTAVVLPVVWEHWRKTVSRSTGRDILGAGQYSGTQPGNSACSESRPLEGRPVRTLSCLTFTSLQCGCVWTATRNGPLRTCPVKLLLRPWVRKFHGQKLRALKRSACAQRRRDNFPFCFCLKPLKLSERKGPPRPTSQGGWKGERNIKLDKNASPKGWLEWQNWGQK